MPRCSQPRSLGLTSALSRRRARQGGRARAGSPRCRAGSLTHALKVPGDVGYRKRRLGERRVTSPVRSGSAGSSIGAWRDWKARMRRVLYPAYESRMVRALPTDQLPKHVGVMLDGNRRWAKAVGADTAHGYRAGAANIEPLLDWCEEVGVEVVTLWLLSTDNLNRPPDQLAGLLEIIEGAVDHPGRGAPLAAAPGGRARPAAGLDRAASSRTPRRRRGTRRACSSTSPSGTAVAARSRTPCARCSRSRPARA